MTFHRTEAHQLPSRAPSRPSSGSSPRPTPTSRGRLAQLAPVALVAGTLLLAGCTSSHSTAGVRASAPPVTAVGSGSVAPLSSGPASGSAVASAVASAAVSSTGGASSAATPAPPVANIEAPAPKAGFQIRVHRGLLLKVNVPQAKAGSTLAFALSPSSSTSLKPLAGHDGYFMGAADGVVKVQVSQDGVAAGSLTVTVWG
jgi:hypothetical protein